MEMRAESQGIDLSEMDATALRSHCSRCEWQFKLVSNSMLGVSRVMRCNPAAASSH